MKNINESGRSMVEMLGVLAIIGVLSIGGIAGYSMAMNRYRANEALDMANKYAVVVYSGYHTAAAMGNSWTAPTLINTGLISDTKELGGATITHSGNEANLQKGIVKLTIEFPTEAVCNAAQSILGIGSTTGSSGSSGGGTGGAPSAANGNPEIATVAADGIMTIAGGTDDASCTPSGCNGGKSITYCFKQS